jgi:hypothetical protein
MGQTSNGKPVSVIEYLYILPKTGMSEKLEAALKAHDNKFHPEGMYVSTLNKVDFGEKAGWFVLVMGPTSYAAFDKPPDIELAHYTDWNTNVLPLVAQFGGMGLWNYDPDLSFGMDIFKKAAHYEIWGVTFKRGQYKRFKPFVEKLKQTYESMKNTAFLVFENPVHTSNGMDIAFVWSFNTFEDWAKDDGTKAAYEKLNGDGSWDLMLNEWDQSVQEYNTELRSFIR